jgi:hypothetical protein
MKLKDGLVAGLHAAGTQSRQNAGGFRNQFRIKLHALGPVGADVTDAFAGRARGRVFQRRREAREQSSILLQLSATAEGKTLLGHGLENGFHVRIGSENWFSCGSGLAGDMPRKGF